MAKKARFLGLLAALFCLTPVFAQADCGPAYGFGGGKVAVLLLTLAAGYWVLTLSQQQTKPLDLIGRALGFLIIIVALGGLLCSVFFRVWCGVKGDGACGYGGAAAMGKWCPFSGHRSAHSCPSEPASNAKDGTL